VPSILTLKDKVTGGTALTGTGKASFVSSSKACPTTGDLTLAVTAGVVTHTFPDLGIHKLCYQEDTKFGIVQTATINVVVATPATGTGAVTGWTLPTTGITAGVASGDITIAGATSGLVGFTTAATCTGFVPNYLITSAKVTAVNLAVGGSHIVCFRAQGGSDSVQQGTLTLTVAGTKSSEVTAMTPASVTASTAATITLTGDGIVTGDLVGFVLDVATTIPTVCVVPTLAVAAEKKATLLADTLTVVGTYTVCFKGKDVSNVAEQKVSTTAGLKLSVVAATGAEAVTSVTLNPTKPTSGTAVTVTLTGALETGMVAITNKTTCADAAATAWTAVPTGLTYTFTPSSTGVHILCYRVPGGSDAVKQTKIELPSVLPKATQTSGVSRVQFSFLLSITVILGLGFGL